MANDSSYYNTTSSRSLAFDPFSITETHSAHSQSTNIIILEESGKVFCPLCLEKVSLNKIEKIDDELFQQYIYNMFEALDQHGEKSQLRRIVLTLLELILKRRPIFPKTDHEFYNILRIVHKVLNDEFFKLFEFPLITKIISSICRNFINKNPIPLQSFWKTTNYMINYAKSQIDKPLVLKTNSDLNLCKFFAATATIIKTYLEILGRFAVDQVSDFIYPLYDDDCLLTHHRRYYMESQITCLGFMEELLLQHCWSYISPPDDRALLDHELLLVGDLYETLEQCFNSSVRLNCYQLLTRLIEKDCLKLSHKLMLRNKKREFRDPVRKFIKTFTIYYIEKKFGTDEEFKKYLQEPDIVEVNFKNALIYCRDSSNHKKITFYFLVNCVSMLHDSKYFCSRKVRKVIKCADPELLNIAKSKVLLKAYLYLTATLFPKVGSLDNVENFVVKTWDVRNGQRNANEEFCFDDKILSWVYDHPEFFKLVTEETISYIFNRDMQSARLIEITELLLRSKRYKNVLVAYLISDESAISYIEELSKCKIDDMKVSPLNELYAILPAIFHNSLLQALNDNEESLPTLDKVQKTVIMLTMMVRSCTQFNLTLDEQYIQDLFTLLESFYMNVTDRVEKTLILLNEFISSIIETNSTDLLRVIHVLEFKVLGYMIHCLADQNYRINLVESIADILISYDNLDYPLRNNIDTFLIPINHEVSNWMLSSSENLNSLALKIVNNVLSNFRTDSSIKIYFATGLLHRMFICPDVFRHNLNLKILSEMLKLDELKYNPLLNRILINLPASVKKEIIKNLDNVEDSGLDSPALSFDSNSSSDFEEEHIDIANILNQLHEEDATNRHESSYKIPNSLFISRSVQDQHLNLIDTYEWEQAAIDSARGAEGA